MHISPDIVNNNSNFTMESMGSAMRKASIDAGREN